MMLQKIMSMVMRSFPRFMYLKHRNSKLYPKSQSKIQHWKNQKVWRNQDSFHLLISDHEEPVYWYGFWRHGQTLYGSSSSERHKIQCCLVLVAQPDDLCIDIWISVMIICISQYLDNRDRKKQCTYASLKYSTPHNPVVENWDEALGSDGYHESEPLWILRTAKNGYMDPLEGPTTALRTAQNSTLTCGLSKTSEGILNWFHILEDFFSFPFLKYS